MLCLREQSLYLRAVHPDQPTTLVRCNRGQESRKRLFCTRTNQSNLLPSVRNHESNPLGHPAGFSPRGPLVVAQDSRWFAGSRRCLLEWREEPHTRTRWRRGALSNTAATAAFKFGQHGSTHEHSKMQETDEGLRAPPRHGDEVVSGSASGGDLQQTTGGASGSRYGYVLPICCTLLKLQLWTFFFTGMVCCWSCWNSSSSSEPARACGSPSSGALAAPGMLM